MPANGPARSTAAPPASPRPELHRPAPAGPEPGGDPSQVGAGLPPSPRWLPTYTIAQDYLVGAAGRRGTRARPYRCLRRPGRAQRGSGRRRRPTNAAQQVTVSVDRARPGRLDESAHASPPKSKGQDRVFACSTCRRSAASRGSPTHRPTTGCDRAGLPAVLQGAGSITCSTRRTGRWSLTTVFVPLSANVVQLLGDLGQRADHGPRAPWAPGAADTAPARQHGVSASPWRAPPSP